MYRVILQSFPNNEVRFGIDELPYPQRRGGDLSDQKEKERKGKQLDEERERWERDNNVIQWRDSNGNLWRSTREGDNYRCDRVRENLVITSEVQDASKGVPVPSGRDYSKPVGFTRFTRNGRHRLLEAGSICEEKRGRGFTGVFVTFTLPGSTWDAYSALSRYSGYIANRVCQCIRDYKWAESYFWVYERQKRGALHLHLFILLKPGQHWGCYREPLRNAWYSALEDVGESSSTDMFRHKDGLWSTPRNFWRYDYQETRKSVAGYLSKYVSKQAESGFSEDGKEGDAGLYPRRWWYMSRDLTKEINERRKTVCAEGVSLAEANDIISCMDAMASSLEPVLSHEYEVDIGRTSTHPRGFGRSYRRLYWFNSQDFADIELSLRSLFLSVIASMQKTRITFKGFALNYGGERIPKIAGME